MAVVKTVRALATGLAADLLFRLADLAIEDVVAVRGPGIINPLEFEW